MNFLVVLDDCSKLISLGYDLDNDADTLIIKA